MADAFDESPFTDNKTHASSLKRVLLIVVVILLLGAAIFGIKQLTSSNSKQAVVSPTPTEAPSPTEMPSPTASVSASPTGKLTPTPTKVVKPTPDKTGLDRSSITVSVLNGSGEVGAASKAADYLKGLGYTITSSGNADSFDFVDVSISVKAADSKFLSLLKTDLGKQYTIGSTSAALPASSSTDAVVIIGK